MTQIRPDSREVNRLPVEQIGLFRERFPGGFRGRAWLTAHRESRRLPAVRGAVVVAERVLETVAGDLHCSVAVRELCELFALSRLVPGSEIGSTLTLPELDEANLCGQLARLLFGVDPFAQRFERWTATLRDCLRREPSWQLVTAPLALTKPDHYVYVQPRMLRRQATCMSPGLVPYLEPGAAAYEQYNAMAHAIADDLRQRGFAPADMFDVYDFIVETLPTAFATGSSLQPQIRDKSHRDRQ